jgi:hypothetical protein
MIELWAQDEGQEPRIINWWVGRSESIDEMAADYMAHMVRRTKGLRVTYWLVRK